MTTLPTKVLLLSLVSTKVDVGDESVNVPTGQASLSVVADDGFAKTTKGICDINAGINTTCAGCVDTGVN